MSKLLYKTCACGKSFVTTRKNVVWCTNRCRLEHARRAFMPRAKLKRK